MATIAGNSNLPTSYYWSLVKDMDSSQKLELVTMLIDSVRPVVTKMEEKGNEHGAPKPYTLEELHTRIAKAERESALGLGQDSEEMFDELEDEFAHEDEALEMADAI